jgi:mRNA turnover protein 4
MILLFTFHVVSLTQTRKKTREQKATVVQDERDALEKYNSLYLFTYENMRSSKFKDVRMDFRSTSRIFLGKNKLLQIALGRTPEDEFLDKLHYVSSQIVGSVGLLLTNQPRHDVLSYFQRDQQQQQQQHYARAGTVASQTVIVTKEMLERHPVSMVEQFRKLGLPVEVQNGELRFYGGKDEHTLCKKGATLTAEACKLLVHFGIKLSEFRLTLLCAWSSDGQFENLSD